MINVKNDKFSCERNIGVGFTQYLKNMGWNELYKK